MMRNIAVRYTCLAVCFVLRRKGLTGGVASGYTSAMTQHPETPRRGSSVIRGVRP